MVDMPMIFLGVTTDIIICFQRFRSDFLADFLHNIAHNSNTFGNCCGCVAGSTKATLSNEGVFSFLAMSTENAEVLL